MYIVLAVAAIGALIVLYFAFAPGPRRWRVFKRARKQLEGGHWDEALKMAQALGPARLSPAWQSRVRHLMGESHQLALDHALKAREFEEGLRHAEEAASLLGLDVGEQRGRVIEASLAELRKTFSEWSGPDPQPVYAAIRRIDELARERPAEATFWQALTQVRLGDLEGALASLTTIQEQVGKTILDVPLYTGMLVHRLGRPQDALRSLAEANRIDPNCPIVPWQMGVSLVASGGDSGLAVRALQRSLGARGLPAWQANPDRFWVEGLPEGRSYVRRLATRYRFACPILGGDLKLLIRQGQLALAQALYRQERWQESADLYGKLLDSSPPTALLLRGYGLALARLGQYDQAYKHLRGALEQEQPKSPITAGYLALCGALGKPTNLDDKPKNINWSLRLLASFPLPTSAEWARLACEVHAEARRYDVAIALEDQRLLSDSLAALNASDASAAAVYSHLAATHPEAVRPEHAFLYARAATVNGVTTAQDLDLFARTFQATAEARRYYEERNWDLGEVEFVYLERAANQAPGRFPEVLGDDYPRRGEAFLLERSVQQEKAGQKGPARASAEVLLRLAPSSVAAHDRLACLHFRGGELARAVELLGGWQRLAPSDHWPLVRQAIIEQERGNASRREQIIEQALSLTQGQLRAAIAFLGARLAIRHVGRGWGGPEGVPALADEPARESLQRAADLLGRCLAEQPDHAEALWCLAAVRSLLGDRAALAAQAPLMDRPEVSDGRFHFLGAVCHLAAKNYRRAADLGARAAEDRAVGGEGQFVAGWAHLRLGDLDGAARSLQAVAADDRSLSSGYARALLGQVSLQRGAYDEAVRWWSAVDSAVREKWGVAEPLRQAVLLSGLLALQQGRFEPAADRFREAAKFGLRDRRLAGLITLALVKAGQALLYQSDEGAVSRGLGVSGSSRAATERQP